MHDRVVGSISEILEESNTMRPDAIHPNIWKIVTKSKITKFAAVAVIIIAVLIGINRFGGSIDVAPSAFAAMKEAVARVPVMHKVYVTDYGDGNKHRTEVWYDFDSRTVISSYSRDGNIYKISSLNYNTMKNTVYDPESKVVEIVYRCDVGPKGYPDSAAEVVDHYLKSYEFRGAKVKHQRGLFDGEDADILLLTIEGNERKNKQWAKLVVNRETHLPMACEKRSVTPKGDLAFEQMMSFYFPTEAPKDIYDVGVPRSSKVIVDSVSEKRYKRKVTLLERIPKLEQSFNEVYRLGDTEILMRIGPEDIHPRLELEQTEREIGALEHEQYLERLAKLESASKNAKDSSKKQLCKLSRCGDDLKESQKRYTAFEWLDGIDRHASRPIFVEGASVREFLERLIGLSKFDYDIAEEILDIVIPGDWIIRTGTPSTKLLSSFNKVLRSYTKRRIYFQKGTVERDVIVARGRFKFRPLSGAYNNSWIHVFSDRLDEDERGGGSSGESLDRFLRQRLAVGHLGQQVVNLAELTDKDKCNFGTHMSSYLKKVPPGPEKEEKVRKLLDNLSQQTGLTFSKERRVVDIWYVEELEE
jgi:hypothetical protein